MDYNDDQYPTYPNEERRGWLVPILLGIIIGILIVTVVIPAVVDDEQQAQDPKDVTESKETPSDDVDKNPSNQPSQQVNVDVTTQVTEIVEKVRPAVVGVTNIQMRADFWRQQQNNEAGTGSGVIYKKEDGYAYIVTNHHVIEGADVIEVVLADERDIEAELLGSDLFTDLAVLRIPDEDIDEPIEMGSSENLKVGEPAIAIGNPLGHMFSGSVTKGVISGTQRNIPVDFTQDGRADWQAEVIQTDAAINPGNSGGALINIKGQLIGINSMKINQTAVEGIGFAIPIDSARPVIEELETTGEVTRPYLGVEIYSLEEVPKTEWKRSLNLPDEVEGGVYIWSIEPLSPAQKAGLKRLDVIVALDGEKILGIVDLRRVLYQEKKVGDLITITFYRNGEKMETELKLGLQQ